MTHDRIKELMTQLSEAQVLADRLLDCQEAHLREINNLNTAQESAEQRAEHWQELAAKSHETASQLLAEREALQAELSSLKADMFVLNNDMGYTTGVLEDVLKQREALQARIDGALMPLKSVAGVARHWAKYSGSADKSDLGCVVVKAIEILTGEGE
jgi:DNA repair ATPase RecN